MCVIARFAKESAAYQPAPKQAKGMGSGAACKALASAYAGAAPVAHLGDAGDDRRGSAVQQGAGQAESFVAGSYRGLAQLAGGQHYLLRWPGEPIEVVPHDWTVGQPD